ncbi:MAG: DnaJ domain-containing protein [Rhodobacterales bacterium]|nr:DnaJ domain-containing protein [Rhodobacterales bacterium]
MALSYIEACAILEVSPGGSDTEIRDAYRLLVKVWHPDRFANDDALRERANAKMARINKAHAIVKEGPSGAPFMGAHSDPDVYTSAEEPAWTWASEPEPDVPPGGFYSRHLSAEDVDGQDVGGTLGILALHYGMGVVAFGGVMVSEGAMSWQERNQILRMTGLRAKLSFPLCSSSQVWCRRSWSGA